MALQVGKKSHATGEGRVDFVVICWQILERLIQNVLMTFERSHFLPTKILSTYFAKTNSFSLITG